MSRPLAPFENRSREYTSVSTPVAFDPAIAWLQCVGAGTVVVKDEAGTAVTYANMSAYEVIVGPFSELTSMTSSKIRMGDGPPPDTMLTGVEASSATSLTTVDSANLSAAVSADTSLVSRLSAADSVVTSATVSADTSLTSRLSTVDSGLTSADASLTTRDSAITSITTSLQTRISVAESTEASKG